MDGAFSRLLERLGEMFFQNGKNPKYVVIQTHDFPDHDAAAAAMGLGKLLDLHGYASRLFYRGEIRSHSLLSMLTELDIPLTAFTDTAMEKYLDAPCIIVDGNPANTNARQVTKLLLGVVDHHPNSAPPSCPFADIRIANGSCSSIIADYWEEAGMTPDKNTATALLIGIETDTDFLSRRVSPLDLKGLCRLFFLGDWQFSAGIIKTALSQRDLPSFQQAISNARIRENFFFTVITVDTSQEVLSILADLFLRLREISVSVIVENEGTARHVSARSRDPAVSAARLIRLALQGIGEGGGHDHMAGGLLYTSKNGAGTEELFQRFVNALAQVKEQA
jgi:nanoRNase/pAp phosphatase (c-di-AMP/oligoRNAs hydrolase)